MAVGRAKRVWGVFGWVPLWLGSLVFGAFGVSGPRVPADCVGGRPVGQASDTDDSGGAFLMSITFVPRAGRILRCDFSGFKAPEMVKSSRLLKNYLKGLVRTISGLPSQRL